MPVPSGTTAKKRRAPKGAAPAWDASDQVHPASRVCCSRVPCTTLTPSAIPSRCLPRQCALNLIFALLSIIAALGMGMWTGWTPCYIMSEYAGKAKC